MQKKVVILGSIVVLLASAIFLMIWRSQIMGPGARGTAGGLVAVDSKGTPIPIPAAQATAAKMNENTAFQQSGGYLVSLKLDPYPPTISIPSDFEVTLADAQGQTIAGATVSVDLTMPGMYMPPNKIDLSPANAGIYRGSGRFTMRGPWRLEVIITISDQTHSVFFDVWL
jgi:hypothetical protein